MTPEQKVLIKTAERGTDEESAEAMKKLREINQTYHWCHEWDGAVICDADEEFKACLCFKSPFR